MGSETQVGQETADDGRGEGAGRQVEILAGEEALHGGQDLGRGEFEAGGELITPEGAVISVRRVRLWPITMEGAVICVRRASRGQGARRGETIQDSLKGEGGNVGRLEGEALGVIVASQAEQPRQ